MEIDSGNRHPFDSNSNKPKETSSGRYLQLVSQPLTDCCSCCCKFDKDYKNKIANDLQEVKNQVKLVLQCLREQSRPGNVAENKENFDDIEERLPIQSEEDILLLETHLRDKDEQKKMVTFLAHIGGHEINTIVKNILKKLFKDSVMSFYNWEGKKGKKMFSSLILSDCIKRAAIMSPNAKGATEQDVITSVKNWLRHASARTNNQKKTQE